MSTYYELLGVPPNATETEIRSAYGRDVLRLQETASDKVAQFRAALDAAFATLVDPDKRAAYDAQLVTRMQDDTAGAADESDDAFKYALRGGLWFAAGGLITAATYAFSQGTYLIAWGPLIFGGFQLVRGLLRYFTVQSGVRRPSHVLALLGLIAVGIVSAGFVGMSESLASQDIGLQDKWNAMVDATSLDVAKADDLVVGVANRPGAWSAMDSADMEAASVLYAGVADTLDHATVPSRLEWYRTGLAKNFHEAAAVTHEYSLVTTASAAAAVVALDNRWNARITDFNALSDKFEAQEGTAKQP